MKIADRRAPAEVTAQVAGLRYRTTAQARSAVGAQTQLSAGDQARISAQAEPARASFDGAKVERLRRAIEAGQLVTDAGAIARAMLEAGGES